MRGPLGWLSRGAVLVALGTLANCSLAAPSEYDPAPVLLVVLDSIEAQFSGTGLRAVLEETALTGTDFRNFEAVGAHPTEVRAFLWANAEQRPWPDSVIGRFPAGVIRVASIPFDVSSPDSVSDWLGFGAYVVYLSFPGFSKDGSSAVVAYSFGCGALCGEGHVARLERRVEGWVIVQDFMYMIS